jgi:hypothetical protein
MSYAPTYSSLRERLVTTHAMSQSNASASMSDAAESIPEQHLRNKVFEHFEFDKGQYVIINMYQTLKID